MKNFESTGAVVDAPEQAAACAPSEEARRFKASPSMDELEKNARLSPVLSLSNEMMSKDEEECNDGLDYWNEQWLEWCQGRTKQEISEAAAVLLSKGGAQVPQNHDGMTQNEAEKEEEMESEEQWNLVPSINEGDVRAYFTRRVSKILTTQPVFLCGSKVLEEEVVGPDEWPCRSPTRGRVRLTLPSDGNKRTYSSQKPRRNSNKQHGHRTRVLEVSEAGPADHAFGNSLVSSATIVPSKPTKRRRLTFKQKPSSDEGMPSKVPSTEHAVVTPETTTRKGFSPEQASSSRASSASPSVASKEKETAKAANKEQAPSAAPVKTPFRHALLGNVCAPSATSLDSASTAKNPEHSVDTQTDGVLSAAPVKTPFRHALLGNACAPSATSLDSTSIVENPERYVDTQTDGVLSAVEMEYAWLCEESLHCLQGPDVCWSFIYEYASSALRATLREGTEFVRPAAAEATKVKRESIRERMQQGYRRPVMAKTIAFHRLALRQGITVEKLRAKMEAQKKKLAPIKGAAKKASRLPVKKRVSQQQKPITRPQGASLKDKSCAANLTASTSHVLSDMEKEIAWLVEESIMQNAFDGIDHTYVVTNASPTLREAISRHSRRWLPRVVRFQIEEVKQAFELEKLRIRQLLYSGYRRPETKSSLPSCRMTHSQYKEQQSHRET